MYSKTGLKYFWYMYKNKSDSDNLYKDFTIALAEIPTLNHILLGFLNLKRG